MQISTPSNARTPSINVIEPTPPYPMPTQPVSLAHLLFPSIGYAPLMGVAGPAPIHKDAVPVQPGTFIAPDHPYPFASIPDAPWTTAPLQVVGEPLCEPLSALCEGRQYWDGAIPRWHGWQTTCDISETASGTFNSPRMRAFQARGGPRLQSVISPYSSWKRTADGTMWSGVDLNGNHYCISDDGGCDVDPNPGGMLRCPTDLCQAGQSMDWYVADMLNGCIAVVNWINGTYEVLASGLDHPQSLTMGGDGFLYVACTGNVPHDEISAESLAGYIARVDPATGKWNPITQANQLAFPQWIRTASTGELIVGLVPPMYVKNVRGLVGVMVNSQGTVTAISGITQPRTSSPGMEINGIGGTPGTWIAFEIDIQAAYGGVRDDIILANSVMDSPKAGWAGFPGGTFNDALCRVNCVTGAISCFASAYTCNGCGHYPWGIALGNDSLGRPRVLWTGFGTPMPVQLRPYIAGFDADYGKNCLSVPNQNYFASHVAPAPTDPGWCYAKGAIDWLTSDPPLPAAFGSRGFSQLGYPTPDDFAAMTDAEITGVLQSVIPSATVTREMLYFLRRQSLAAQFSKSMVPIPPQ